MEKMELDINITQEDIDKGKPMDSHYCPIGRRLRLMGFKRISVDNEEIRFERDGKKWITSKISNPVFNFIEHVDKQWAYTDAQNKRILRPRTLKLTLISK